MPLKAAPKKKKMTDHIAVARKGGLARVANMTPEELSAANRKASLARWARKKAETN